jgi:hypothetical protein
MQEADSKGFYTLLGGSVGTRVKPWSSDAISKGKEAVCRFLVVADFEQAARAGAPKPAASQTIRLKLLLDRETSHITEVLRVMADFMRNDHRGRKVTKCRQMRLHESCIEIDGSVLGAIGRPVYWPTRAGGLAREQLHF